MFGSSGPMFGSSFPELWPRKTTIMITVAGGGAPRRMEITAGGAKTGASGATNAAARRSESSKQTGASRLLLGARGSGPAPPRTRPDPPSVVRRTAVRTEGLEPSRELPRQNLNLVRLPIPPRSREARGGVTGRPDPVKQSAVDAAFKAPY